MNMIIQDKKTIKFGTVLEKKNLDQVLKEKDNFFLFL